MQRPEVEQGSKKPGDDLIAADSGSQRIETEPAFLSFQQQRVCSISEAIRIEQARHRHGGGV